MTKINTPLFSFVLFLYSYAAIAQPATDLEALLEQEALEWTTSLEVEEGGSLQQVALQLQDSGIDDSRVYDAAKTVILSELDTLNSGAPPSSSRYIISSLARFIAGSESYNHREVLETLTVGSKNRRVANLAKTLTTRSSWYASRNQIMNDFSNYGGEYSLQTARFLNLINASNPEFGRYAAESMTRLDSYEKVVTDRMAEIVQEKFKSPGLGTQLDMIAWYIRFIGREGSYQNVLNEVADYKGLDKKLKKHVRLALQGK